MTSAKEYRDQTKVELEVLASEKRKELFELVNKFAQEKKLDNPSKVHALRKDIARILTVLREKELAK